MAAALGAAALAAASCGNDEDGRSAGNGSTTRVEVVEQSGRKGAFDPNRIYRADGPGVVTVISILGERGGGLLDQPEGDPRGGLGSGFVISDSGEIATNAHVVTTGEGEKIQRAKQVFVKFEDGNEVPAKIVGFDPNSDVALIKVDPDGLKLRPLRLGSSSAVAVGSPVAAIGSPFGERGSISIGIVSAIDRSIDSLTGFAIAGALQTDAAINKGNSGGPLVDARGEVVGINSQIRSESGGSEGVGYAVPVDTVKRSLDQLREDSKVSYAFIGVSTTTVFPQLADRFDLGADHGAWIQEVTPGGPASKAGLKAGTKEERFHAQPYRIGGDIIAKLEGRDIRQDSNLPELLARFKPGDEVKLEVLRGSDRREVTVTLAERPLRLDAPRQRP